jgi:hypothetical protein
VDEAFAEDGDDGGFAENGGAVQVLVAVEKEAWLGQMDVVREGVKALMDFAVSLMNAERELWATKTSTAGKVRSRCDTSSWS